MKAVKFSVSSVPNDKSVRFAWAGLSKRTAVVFQGLKKIPMTGWYSSLLSLQMICFIIWDVLWFETGRHQEALTAHPNNIDLLKPFPLQKRVLVSTRLN